jgi:hypothetical protein
MDMSIIKTASMDELSYKQKHDILMILPDADTYEYPSVNAEIEGIGLIRFYKQPIRLSEKDDLVYCWMENKINI